MKTLFWATLLVIAFIPLFGANEWLYYKHFPWVYDHQAKEWIYLNGSSDGKIYAWRQSTKEWAEFKVDEETEEAEQESEGQTSSSWDKKYEGWMQNPNLYGGVEVLEKINEAKENQTQLEWDLFDGKIVYDISPLAELTHQAELLLQHTENISDITPLSNLTNLHTLYIQGNNIQDISVLKNLTKLKRLGIGDNQITDFSPLNNLRNLQFLDLAGLNIKDISFLENVTTGIVDLNLDRNQITNLDILSRFTNLEILSLEHAINSTDLFLFWFLPDLRYLQSVTLWGNDLTPDQKVYLDSFFTERNMNRTF